MDVRAVVDHMFEQGDFSSSAIKSMIAEHRPSKDDTREMVRLVDERKCSLEAEIAVNESELATLKASQSVNNQKLSAAQVFHDFIDGAEYKLTPCYLSRLHQFADAYRNGTLLAMEDCSGYGSYHSFVVQHDWAAAFKGSGIPVEETIRPPFDECVFEYAINDVGVLHTIHPDNKSDCVMLALHSKGYWSAINVERNDNPVLWAFMRNLTNAVLVALDSSVAMTDQVAAPVKLNKKRIESGKVPLNAYHVVKIRPRTSKVVSDGGYKGTVRLHFRRGHYRHYDDQKAVWINWMLVGNPDLGFIEKHYRVGP